MKYDKDLSCPSGRRGRAGEPGFPAMLDVFLHEKNTSILFFI